MVVTIQNPTAAATNISWTLPADATLVAVGGNVSFAISGNGAVTYTDVTTPTAGTSLNFLVVQPSSTVAFALPSGGLPLIGGEQLFLHFSGKGTAQLYLS